MKFGIFVDGKLVREFEDEKQAVANGRWKDVYPILTPSEWLDYESGKWCIDDELFIRYESIYGNCISPVLVKGINKLKAIGKIIVEAVEN